MTIDADAAILFVDDDEDIRTAGRLLLQRHFATVVVAAAADDLPRLLAAQRFDVVLLDMNYAPAESSGREGHDWITRIRELDPHAVVLAITAFGNIATAVEAIKRGATDFLTKPWENEKLVASVRAAVALRRSRADATHFRRRSLELATAPGGSGLVFQSDAMREVMELVERAAPTEANVLVLGENGTGKELVARELHRRSQRAAEVMLAVDLGSLAESLFESELFGHRRGAFTDARDDRMGRLQAAHGGTLFLDEIGNLPPRLQAKLLTVLERRVVVPIGDTHPTAIDVRVVSATNLADDRLADDATFRQDLLYRLNTVAIRLPPLRQRRDDIPLLVEHFLALHGRRYRRTIAGVTDRAMARLLEYRWPGNVRELAHAVERAMILSSSDLLDETAFRLAPAAVPTVEAPPVDAAEILNLEELEKQAVMKALRKHGWNVSHAARELGITRTSLYRRMEKYGL
jgi:DNA-binding NtrC family response regulator